MKTFLLSRKPGPEVALRGGDFHYLIHVLRLKTGDTLKATDGEGKIWRYRVGTVTEDCLILTRGRREIVKEQELVLSLWQCLPKGKKMDLIVRQATETGVSHIVPLISIHTVVRFEAGGSDYKRDRWQRIAREALQQSGASCLPLIEAPQPLSEWIEKKPAGVREVRLFLHQEPAGVKYDTYSLHKCLAGEVEQVSLLVGPEGGLSAEEVNLLLARGFLPVYLGPCILRTETAALYGLAAIRTIVQERTAWRLSE